MVDSFPVLFRFGFTAGRPSRREAAQFLGPAIDEAEALSLVILGPVTPHVQGRARIRRDGGGHGYADALSQHAAAAPQ